MSSEATAREVVALLQAAVDSRDVDRLTALFDDDAVLIGTAAYNHGPEAVRAYLAAVVGQPGSLRWDLAEVHVVLQTSDLLGFTAVGQVVFTEDGVDDAAPFRLAVTARRTPAGWRLLSFHGSLPSDG